MKKPFAIVDSQLNVLVVEGKELDEIDIFKLCGGKIQTDRIVCNDTRKDMFRTLSEWLNGRE